MLEAALVNPYKFCMFVILLTNLLFLYPCFPLAYFIYYILSA
jgi:hypothetical protein